MAGASFTVGSKEFTEQLILGKITLLALEEAGADVEGKIGISGTETVRTALTSGEIDVYWEYTGSGWTVLGHDPSEAPPDEQEVFDRVAKEDLSENGVKWFALAPANNGYAIATSTEAQQKLGVSTLSDYAELVSSNPEDATTCAASDLIDSTDGLPGLEKAYGFDLADAAITEVDFELIFERVHNGIKYNFGETFATDGRIPANEMVLLEDDRQVRHRILDAVWLRSSWRSDRLQRRRSPLHAPRRQSAGLGHYLPQRRTRPVVPTSGGTRPCRRRLLLPVRVFDEAAQNVRRRCWRAVVLDQAAQDVTPAALPSGATHRSQDPTLSGLQPAERRISLTSTRY